MEMDTDAMSGAMELMDTAGRNLGTEWATVSDRLAATGHECAGLYQAADRNATGTLDAVSPATPTA